LPHVQMSKNVLFTEYFVLVTLAPQAVSVEWSGPLL